MVEDSAEDQASPGHGGVCLGQSSGGVHLKADISSHRPRRCPVSFGPRTSPGASDRPLMCSIQREYPSSVSTLPQDHHQWASSPTTCIFPFWDDGTRVTHTVPGLGHPLLEKLPHPPAPAGRRLSCQSVFFVCFGRLPILSPPTRRRPHQQLVADSLVEFISGISDLRLGWEPGSSLVTEPRRPRPSSSSSPSAILMMACKQGQGWTWMATGILMGCVWIHVLDKNHFTRWPRAASRPP